MYTGYEGLIEELRTDNEGCGTRCDRAADAIEMLVIYKAAFGVWNDKTQFMQESPYPKTEWLGRHRVDILVDAFYELINLQDRLSKGEPNVHGL